MTARRATDRIRVARAALDAHDALQATRASEPPSDDDGMPINGPAWIRWHDTISKPAYARWDAAMDELAEMLGTPDTMSRHPFNFRPICEAIIRGEA